MHLTVLPLRSASPLAVSLAGLFLALTIASSASAEEDSKWHLRLFASYVNADLEGDDIDSDTRIEDDDDAGLGISLEHRFSRRVGLEFGALFTTPDIGFQQRQPGGRLVIANDGLRLTPVYAALNVHLTPARKVDAYVGPMLAYVLYSDLVLDAGGGLVAEIDADDDLAFGANLGLDVDLGQGRWTLGASAKYLDTTFEGNVVGGDPDDTAELDVDPLILSLGVGYRF